MLNNKGPDIPRQYLLGSNGVRRTLVDNAALKTSLALITLPAATFTNLTHPGERGLTFNAKIIHPVGFDPKRAHFYPLIVQTYNGPNSQRVTKAWSLDVHSFMASHWHEGTVSPFVDDVLLDEEQFHHRQSSGTREDDMKRFRRRTSQPPFVVLHIDVRGTGFRGEAFRSPVTGR